MPAKPITGSIAAVPPFRNDPTLPCRINPPDLWFPDAENRVGRVRAQKLCAGCSRRDECLVWALQTRQSFGIYGGKTAGEREQILRDMQGRRQ